MQTQIHDLDEDNRRYRRSSDPEVATRYQLEQVVSDFGLKTCVLVDEAGQLLSAADDQLELGQALAAIAPNLTRGITSERAFARLSDEEAVDPAHVRACAFYTGGRKYYLAAVGEQETYRDVGMYRAMLGIRRIRKQMC